MKIKVRQISISGAMQTAATSKGAADSLLNQVQAMSDVGTNVSSPLEA